MERPMKLYNTLTRKVQTFKPAGGNTVRLYTCGPTVYDYYHIGNLRNAVFNDTLRRVLEAAGYKVNHVMNITDVGHLVSDADEGEDKLEKGARREGKTVWEVAAYYTQAFKEDMAALNVLPPNAYASRKYKDNYARATEFIDQQIEMVQLLLDKGYAYRTQQAIYFEVGKLPDYGILTGQRLADKQVGARNDIVVDKQKRNPQDFAVWFFAVGHFTDHSMQWESPWGNGFPGWHLECSAIIHSTLGDPIDLHTGGVDHIGTHHPNEMAQTQAAFGHPLARYWLHNEFILVDGAKMAKSKGNSYTLKNLVDKGFDPLAYRLLVLQAHYRSELNFTWESLEAAQNRLNKLEALADLKWQSAEVTNTPISFKYVKQAMLEYLQDDLNTPWSFAVLATELENSLEEAGFIPHQDLEVFQAILEFIDSVFALSLSSRPDITPEQKQLIAARETARRAKNWARADQYRRALAAQGVALLDTPHGPIWRRQPTTAASPPDSLPRRRK